MAESIIPNTLNEQTSGTISNSTYLATNINYTKNNKLVCVSYYGNMKSIPKTTDIELGTLPSGYRPPYNIAVPTISGAGQVQAEIHTDGKIVIYNYGTAQTSTTYCRWTVCFIIA